jgi:hypothetical protein
LRRDFCDNDCQLRCFRRSSSEKGKYDGPNRLLCTGTEERDEGAGGGASFLCADRTSAKPIRVALRQRCAGHFADKCIKRKSCVAILRVASRSPHFSTVTQAPSLAALFSRRLLHTRFFDSQRSCRIEVKLAGDLTAGLARRKPGHSARYLKRSPRGLGRETREQCRCADERRLSRHNTSAEDQHAIRSIAKSGYAYIEAYRQAGAEAAQSAKNSAVTENDCVGSRRGK